MHFRRSTPRAFLLAALLVALAFAPLALGASSTPGRFAVGFHAWPDGLEVGGEYEGARILVVEPALSFIVVQAEDAGAFLSRASEDARVRYAEPDVLVQLVRFTPNDPRYTNGDMYGPQLVGAPAAWDVSLGSASAIVCVIDSGVRRTHEDIPNERYLGGYDYWNGDSDPNDENGHGTHVTGTVLARTNNGKGVAGLSAVSWQHVRVVNAQGQGYVSDIARGMRWCKDNGAHVATMSLGTSSGSSTMADAVSYAWNGGVALVAAAGNDGCYGCVNYPAAYSNVIAVACVDESRGTCWFSSGGPEVDIAAPGDAIVSTYHSSNTAYAFLSGTSMAAPHVAGALGLLKSVVPTATKTDLRDRLLQNAQDLGTPGFDGWTGHGLVRADLAIRGTPPAAPALACAPLTLVTSKNVTCTLSAADPDRDRVFFQLAWGDGTVERVPATGTVASGAAVTATHRYAEAGAYALQVNATEDTPAARVGPNATLSLDVTPNTAPSLASFSCSPSPSAMGEAVTCSLRASDDSDGVAFDLDWGDGSPAVRLPGSGWVAPGATVTAQRTLSVEGLHTLTARAFDDATPSLAGAATSLAHDVRDCLVQREGQIAAGSPLVVGGVTSFRELGIPASCWDITYEVDTDGPLADVDVCWMKGAILLRCDTGTDPQRGLVPAQTDRVEIRARGGALVDYRLTIPASASVGVPPPPPQATRVIQDDDGEMDAIMSVDYTDDHAAKHLPVGVGDLLVATGARLQVTGLAYLCTTNSATHVLLVNNVPLTLFSPCTRFSRAEMGAASFAIPLELLVPGIENRFEIQKPLGSWTSSNLMLGIDMDRDNGKSEIVADGNDVAGELMWRLELTLG